MIIDSIDVTILDRDLIGVGAERFPVGPTVVHLLRVLAEEPHRVFTKDELIARRVTSNVRRLDTAACRVRLLLGRHGVRAVINVWGVGYRLTDAQPCTCPSDCNCKSDSRTTYCGCKGHS
jgi:DNA-binding winged helix-turn-helix (wHTH) protein